MSDENQPRNDNEPEPPLELVTEAAPESSAPENATLVDAHAAELAAPEAPEPAPEPATEEQPATESVATPRAGWGGLGIAIAFLTRLPIGPRDPPGPGALARAMGMFPLAGVVVGGIGGAVFALAHLLLPASIAAILALAATVLVTGALHEDGLADTADGFGGGRSRERKLSIMRDSRIGTFGMIALALSLGLRAVALAEIGVATNEFGGSLTVVGALVAAHALSRAAIPVAMQALIPARGDGLGVAAGQPGAAQTGIAVTLAVVIAALVLSPPGAALAALAGATIGTVAMVSIAHAQIGGHTGDVLGAVEQAAETVALLAILAAL
jgi:adenosylcobinamide-GDP ribazoletransferase